MVVLDVAKDLAWVTAERQPTTNVQQLGSG